MDGRYAEQLAAAIAPFNGTVVFVQPHWGADPFSHDPAPPLPPGRVPRVADRWGWPDMRAVAAETSAELWSRLGAWTVDTSWAMAMRPDCRSDHLHFADVRVHLSVTWWMVQSLLSQVASEAAPTPPTAAGAPPPRRMKGFLPGAMTAK